MRNTKVGMLLVVAVGCRETVVEPRVVSAIGIEGHASAAGPFPACTKHWKAAVSGKWHVLANWNPAGVPAVGDVVCIDAPGKYTVTVERPIDGDVLIVGGLLVSATVALAPVVLPMSSSLPEGLQVVSGSTLQFDKSATVSAGYAVLDGVVRVTAGDTGVLYGDSLSNGGTVDVNTNGYMALSATLVRNSGSITIAPNATVSSATPQFYMEGGQITGVGTMTVGSHTGTFTWSGGSIPPRPIPRVWVDADLVLASTAVDGAITVYAGLGLTGVVSRTIQGDIGPAVRVEASEITALTVEGSGPGTFFNSGTLILRPMSPPLIGPWVTGDNVVNNGSIVVDTTSNPTLLLVDSLTNLGSMTVNSVLAHQGTYIGNSGTISVSGVGLLTSLGMFDSDNAGVQTGPLLVNGTLVGTGSVGDVTVIGGTVEPGSIGAGPVVGTLTFASLVLDAASTLVADVGGTTAGTHDEVVVTGRVAYGGATLSVREVVPFVSGNCGQIVPIISDNSFPLNRGAFAKFVGLSPGPGRGWRIYNPTALLELVGHDPNAAASRYPSAVSVTEGGAGSSYAVCLRDPPVQPVTVTPSAGGNQLSAMSPLSFFPSTWALPQQVVVTAVDDALYEPPPQTAVITHTVTSVDPAYKNTKVSSVTVTIADNDGTANVGLEIDTPAPNVSLGSPFTIAFTVNNLGPNTSSGATFTVPVSAGFIYQSATGFTSCTYDVVTGTTCLLPTVGVGASIPLTLTFTAQAIGSYATTFTVNTLQLDPVLTNNARTLTVSVF